MASDRIDASQSKSKPETAVRPAEEIEEEEEREGHGEGYREVTMTGVLRSGGGKTTRKRYGKEHWVPRADVADIFADD